MFDVHTFTTLVTIFATVACVFTFMEAVEEKATRVYNGTWSFIMFVLAIYGAASL